MFAPAAFGADPPVAVSGYHLGRGDVISIHVYGEPDLGGQQTIGELGTVNIPLLGEVQVAGKTVSELASLLTDRWGRDYLVNPQVTVMVTTYASKKIHVLGQVANPGEYALRSDTTTLSAALLMAGGQTRDASRAIILTRPRPAGGETSSEIDLDKTNGTGGGQDSVVILPGDRIDVPLRPQLAVSQGMVYISGEIRGPGAYPLKPGLSVLSLAILAGGLTDQAAPARTVITRSSDRGIENILIDLDEIIAGRVPDVPVQNDDKVFVPQLRPAEQFVYLEGQVKKTGAYPYVKGMTALDLTILGGGFTDTASPRKATLIRKKGETREVIRVDLNAVKKGKEADVLLEPGDLLSIPEGWL